MNYIEGNNLKGGKNFYGQPIGIIQLDTRSPKIPGDVSNAFTFDFPVRYKVVKGINTKRIIQHPDSSVVKNFIEAAQELEAEGVRAITTSCGYLIWFQKEIANSVNVPVFTSSLIQVPMVARMIRTDQKIGILVADSRTINKNHLKAANIENIPIVIKGSEDTPAFYNTYPVGGETLNYSACREGVINMVRNMLKEHPEIGAIVCEGTNYSPFRSDVIAATGIPFFDIVTLTRMVYQCIAPMELPHGCM